MGKVIFCSPTSGHRALSRKQRQPAEAQLTKRNIMKNHLAVALVAAAQHYLDCHIGFGCSAAKSDFSDLMRIAKMIESNKDSKAIARAIWNLDTTVRDTIPDEVYRNYIS